MKKYFNAVAPAILGAALSFGASSLAASAADSHDLSGRFNGMRGIMDQPPAPSWTPVCRSPACMPSDKVGPWGSLDALADPPPGSWFNPQLPILPGTLGTVEEKFANAVTGNNARGIQIRPWRLNLGKGRFGLKVTIPF